MPRVKRGVSHVKRRHNLLKAVKGYQYGRKKKIKQATEAYLKAGRNAFKDRRRKKREFRSLWQVQINAGTRLNGTTYSRFIDALKKAHVELDRKVLADIAQNNPAVFTKIVEAVKK